MGHQSCVKGTGNEDLIGSRISTLILSHPGKNSYFHNVFSVLYKIHSGETRNMMDERGKKCYIFIEWRGEYSLHDAVSCLSNY